jgi:hypothetical protein
MCGLERQVGMNGRAGHTGFIGHVLSSTSLQRCAKQGKIVKAGKIVAGCEDSNSLRSRGQEVLADWIEGVYQTGPSR